MTDATQNTAANSNRRPAYNLAGSVSSIEVRTDRTGKPYTVAIFETVVQGKTTTRKAMAFGKAHEAISGLQEGPCRLYVTFDGGVFTVIGLGLPPKSETAAPANDVAPQPEAAPMAEQPVTEEVVAEKPKRARRSRAKTAEKLAA